MSELLFVLDQDWNHDRNLDDSNCLKLAIGLAFLNMQPVSCCQCNRLRGHQVYAAPDRQRSLASLIEDFGNTIG